MDKKTADSLKWNIKISLTVIPIVTIMIITFFILSSRYILRLSEQNLKLQSADCANKLNDWTAKIESELDIYKKTIEDNFSTDAEILKYIRSTYNVHKEYPIGLYLGESDGTYLDGAGWDPPDDWILTERPWYTGAENSYTLVFSEPYIDEMYDKPCISVSSRLRCPGKIRVMATDVYLDYANSLISDITSGSSVDGALFVTNDNRIIIANSNKDKVCIPLDSDSSLISKKAGMLLDEKKYGQNTVDIGNTTYYFDIERMDTTGWFLITYVKQSTILKTLYHARVIMSIIAFLGTAVLIILMRRYAGEMSRMSIKSKTDKLTSSLNREGFAEEMHRSLEKNRTHGILLMIDMDNFKSVNDRLGHPTGDKVLCEFANILENVFNRKNEVIARIGGDEFAVFIGNEINREDLEKILQRFTAEVRARFDAEYADCYLSASIGGSFLKEGQKYPELYKAADDNLYKAKRGGKNRFVIE
jgi:diguanylate cyclase (GGDEF)-like protein